MANLELSDRSVDSNTSANVPLLLECALNDYSSAEEKKRIIHELGNKLFSKHAIAENDPQRSEHIRSFISAALKSKVREKENPTLTDAFTAELTSARLESLADESSFRDWDVDTVNTCIEAYVKYQTVESKFGREHTSSIYRRIAKNVTRARVLDENMVLVANTVQNQGRGTVIQLGSSGLELAEITTKKAFEDALEELGYQNEDGSYQAIRIGYYRNCGSIVNLDESSADPREQLMTPAQFMAQLARVEYAGTRGAAELPLPFKIDKNNKISIFLSVPQVGAYIGPGSAFVEEEWFKKLEKFFESGTIPKGIVMPQRARNLLEKFWQGEIPDMEGNIQDATAFYPPKIGIMYSGDGANRQTLENQPDAVKRPIVNIILNNGVQIGAKLEETYTPSAPLKDIGKGVGIPGIDVQIGEYDQLYLATRFATIRASYGLSTNIDAKVVRLPPHSSAHGNYLGGEPIRNITYIAENNKVDANLIKEIGRIGTNTHLLKVRNGLRKFLDDNKSLDVETKTAIEAYCDSIIDPNELLELSLRERNYLNECEMTDWKNEADNEFQKVRNDILALPYPDPNTASSIQPQRLRFRYHPQEDQISSTVTLSGSDAIKKAVQEGLDDPRGHLNLVTGVDAHKGPKVLLGSGGQILFKDDGGYWSELSDLVLKPHQRWHNGPIDENMIVAEAFGRAMTSTDPETLEEAIKVLVNLEYIEYALHAFPALRYMGNLLMTTDGQVTSKALIMASTGASPGGGTGHAHEDAGTLLGLPDSMYIYYPSDPKDMYQLMRWALVCDQPGFFMWNREAAFSKETFSTELDEKTRPGRARYKVSDKLNENLMQVIACGPSLTKVKAEIDKRGEQAELGINWFDPRTLRPFPWDDLEKYLEAGLNKMAPIVLVQQDKVGDGYGDYIKSILTGDKRFLPLIRGREIRVLGSKPVDAPPCDGILLSAVLPDIPAFISAWEDGDLKQLQDIYQAPYESLERDNGIIFNS